MTKMLDTPFFYAAFALNFANSFVMRSMPPFDSPRKQGDREGVGGATVLSVGDSVGSA